MTEQSSTRMENTASYRTMSLLELAELIAEHSDQSALVEFHSNRSIFFHPQAGNLVFVDYLGELRKWASNGTWLGSKPAEIADNAYNITLDKFFQFPSDDKNMKPEGRDCRKQFRAFVVRLRADFCKQPPSGPVEEEYQAGKAMQTLVRRHFSYSLMDAQREVDPSRSRYDWNVGGRVISVWLPRYLAGHERKKWLEDNITTDLADHEAARKIQDEINHKLVSAKTLFEDEISSEIKSRPGYKPDETPDYHFPFKLAKIVAEEKVHNIHLQRPAIRALGSNELQRMILRIFNDLDAGNLDAHKIAREFGLSKAAFSRFASTKRKEDERGLADLWVNTAHVFCSNPVLREIAQGAGFWELILADTKIGKRRVGKELS